MKSKTSHSIAQCMAVNHESVSCVFACLNLLRVCAGTVV